jgi:hypothetical protein
MNEIKIVFDGPSDFLYFYLAGLVLMAVSGYLILAFPDDHPVAVRRIKTLFSRKGK